MNKDEWEDKSFPEATERVEDSVIANLRGDSASRGLHGQGQDTEADSHLLHHHAKLRGGGVQRLISRGVPGRPGIDY